MQKASYRFRELIAKIPLHEVSARKLELSELLDISLPHLNRLLRGQSDPSGSQLRIMADFFGVQVDDLYTEKVTNHTVQLATA